MGSHRKSVAQLVLPWGVDVTNVSLSVILKSEQSICLGSFQPQILLCAVPRMDSMTRTFHIRTIRNPEVVHTNGLILETGTDDSVSFKMVRGISILLPSVNYRDTAYRCQLRSEHLCSREGRSHNDKFKRIAT